jgi:hypothetical protein
MSCKISSRLCRLFLSVTAVAILAGGLSRANAQCQPHAPNPPSPPAQASVNLNGKQVTIDYCAPSMRGRKIFGDGGLVPYDHWWRTGANSATTLHTDSSLMIGKKIVPAGTYTIYTIPEEHEWKLIINKQTGQWGTEYNEGQDLVRIPMLDGVIPSAPVEVFRIHFEHTKGSRTELHLTWDNADVYVPVKAID